MMDINPVDRHSASDLAEKRTVLSQLETTPGAFPTLAEVSGAMKSVLHRGVVPQVFQFDGSYDGFLGGPIDMSGALPPTIQPKDVCSTMAPAPDMNAALASAHLGNSALHRVYEVAAQTSPGTHLPADFPAVYGTDAAQKLQNYGLTQVAKSGNHTDVTLKAPVQVSEGSSSLLIAKDLSFNSTMTGVVADLKSIKGVTAYSGWLGATINSATIRPLENGYMSATVTASLGASFAPSIGLVSQKAELCAHPDGRIYR